MMELVRFKPEHAHQIQEQEATAYLRPMISEAHLAVLAAQEHSYTIMRGGLPIACGGIIQHWPGRYEAWAMLEASRPKDFLTIHNATRRFLQTQIHTRIEAVVECGFQAGHRWLRLLGFDLESPYMRRYGPDGRDYSMYVRVS